MTPTTPTPGAEPHQPGVRATTADGRVLTLEQHAAYMAIIDRLRWPSMHWGVEDVHPEAWPHLAIAAADAALAHLAERRAGDVEAIERALREHRDHCGRGCWCGWEYPDDLQPSDAPWAIRRHQAAQIAALTPTRGVSAETHTEWGVKRDVASPMPSREAAEREIVRQRTGRWPMHPVLVRREVTDWREVRDGE